MNETCKSCGTVFDLDENALSDKIHWLKCGVCNEKWSVSLEKNRTISEEKIENISINNSDDNEINKVKSELASIKLVVENKSKQMSNINNPILELKNKSVAEIAAELSASKLKTDNLKVIESLEQKKNINQKDKINIKKTRLFPLVLVFCVLVTGVSVFFRSPIMSYSHLYFPLFTQKYSEGIISFFNFIKLPIFVELKHIEIIDFGATFQKNDVKFSGVLKNNTSRPILAPKIKVLAVTEDGKIVVQKIISITKKILMPSSKVEFYDIVKMNFKKENISVRATILKEILVY